MVILLIEKKIATDVFIRKQLIPLYPILKKSIVVLNEHFIT